MPTLNERIINELQRTDIQNLSRLISFMKGEKGFFWVRSGGHDHWTNGTAQHSWRVYQYMRHMWEHPEEIPCNRKALRDSSYKADSALAPDNVKALTEKEIILTGLLHDVGKMWGCSHHASKSKRIIDEYLGKGFSQNNPEIVAAIFFHHNKDKNGGELNKYKDSTLKKLLNRADSMAAGTTCHSTRFKEHRSQQHGVVTADVKHLRRVAMDRTRQVLDYRFFLDYTYNLQTLEGFASKIIVWNTSDEVVKAIKSGTAKSFPIQENTDYITAAHRYHLEKGGGLCLAVGIDLSMIRPDERNLRQENPLEEELLICSNILMAFFQTKDIGSHRYAYTMRKEAGQHYHQQSHEKGILLPNVTFFRDGESEGFRMVVPWSSNVLLVPGWRGVLIMSDIPT